MKLQSIAFNKNKYSLHDVVRWIIKYHIGVPSKLSDEKNHIKARYLCPDKNKKYISRYLTKDIQFIFFK